MKLSALLSITLLGASTAVCIPIDQAQGNAVAKAPLAVVAPAKNTNKATTTRAQSRNGRGRGRGRGQGQGQGRNGRGRNPPATAASQPPTAAAPVPVANNTNNSNKGGGTIQANLVPEFGIQAGVDPNNGNCKGLNGVIIPCVCPPDRAKFIAKIQEFVSAGNALGTPVSFPTDNSLGSQITRLTTSIVTLQNFNGSPGSGCPASSTTFVGQRAALLAKQ